MADDAILLNGINGADGSYLVPQLSLAQVSRLAQGDKLDIEDLQDLKTRVASAAPTFGLVYGIDSEDLAQSGWCVVFAHDADLAVQQALAPLLDLRRAQAGARYQQYAGDAGVRPGDSARTWLARAPRNKGLGPADPRRVPYYVLLVGDPEAIPFRFQYELDVNYAVGRIHFDNIAEYTQYAQCIIAAENSAPNARQRRALFFGPRNHADRATQLSVDRLLTPLVKALEANVSSTWKMETLFADAASKEQLRAQFFSEDRPSILFTASHGMGFPKNDPRQYRHQGALLCQNWPGPLKHRGPIPAEFYFSADDLEGANLQGLIAFHFACYGGGTPRWDDYAYQNAQRMEIAPRAFVANLPKRELSLASGGALAVVGHVERAWSYSFEWPGAGDQLAIFESAMNALLAGSRLGSAMDPFGLKYADLSVSLESERDDISFGKQPDDLLLSGLWTARNDSRSYVIIGDPAVRITA